MRETAMSPGKGLMEETLLCWTLNGTPQAPFLCSAGDAGDLLLGHMIASGAAADPAAVRCEETASDWQVSCALKPNAIEAETLTGMPVHGPDSAARAARRLVELGVERVFITLGEKGVCCADEAETLFMPGGAVRMAHATGAGDAFTAALAWGRLRDLSLRDCAVAGLAAASIAVESMETVSPDICEAALLQRMQTLNE